MTEHHAVHLRRVYEEAESGDGNRILVDRLWPRGLSKEAAHVDLWLKGIAPSTDLRHWYGHDPSRYDEFVRRYREELSDPEHQESFDRLADKASHGTVTLLTSTKSVDASHLPILLEELHGDTG